MDIKSDFYMCSPTGVRILVKVSALLKWVMNKLDAITAFLQPGSAERAVHVIPPKSYKELRFLWLLLVAVHGLVNSEAKWQVPYDQAITELGVIQSKMIPHLFYKLENNKLVLVVAKIFRCFDDDWDNISYGSIRKIISKTLQNWVIRVRP